jgi:hypothetical protein
MIGGVLVALPLLAHGTIPAGEVKQATPPIPETSFCSSG